MNKDSINEMEQIQKGLEEFLEKEVAGYRENRAQAEAASGYQEEPEAGQRSYGEHKSRELNLDMLGGGQEAVRVEQRPVKRNAPSGTAGRRTKTEQIPERMSDSARRTKEDIPVAPAKKKKKKKKSKLKVLLVVLLLFVLLLAGLWYSLMNSIYQKMNYSEIPELTDQPMKEDGVTNILLIGNDSRTQGEDGRSDAMILLSISNQTDTIHMTSLLRDMYVQIPGYKDNRLNAAYSYGGAQLLMDTLELNFDIHVNRYVQVNFQAFANLVDAVGGVELELSSEEVEYINAYLVEYNILEGRDEGTDYLDPSQSGLIELNGPQALAYCRNRYLGTDFGRTERQRKVLEAAIRKAPLALAANPGGLIDDIVPNLTTNLTKSELMSLSLEAPKVLTYEIVQGIIPVEGSYTNAKIRDMAVLQIDFEKNKEYIRREIYGSGEVQKESGTN